MTDDLTPDDERTVEYLDDERPEDRPDPREGQDFDHLLRDRWPAA